MKVANDSTDKWDIGGLDFAHMLVRLKKKFSGQWVGSSQRHMLELIKELGVEMYEQFSDGTKWMQLGKQAPRKYTSDLPKASEIG